MTPHSVNDTNSFICGWYADDQTMSIVDNMNYQFDALVDEYGLVGLLSNRVDKTGKDSTDLASSLLPQDLQHSYTDHVARCWQEYSKIYTHADELFYLECNQWQLQEYKPKSVGYPAWHYERSFSCIFRHCVFMTYLNDVTDEGVTEFLYYPEIKIKPEKGLTLIFPADFTHTHCGRGSPTQHKRFATGWITHDILASTKDNQ